MDQGQSRQVHAACPFEDMAPLGKKWRSRMGLSDGLPALRAELANFSHREVDKPDFLHPAARRRARFRCITGANKKRPYKWCWRSVALGACWILPHDLSDIDIDCVFRATEVSFSRHAMGDYVCS